jgi:hypothetical protein
VYGSVFADGVGVAFAPVAGAAVAAGWTGAGVAAAAGFGVAVGVASAPNGSEY